MKHISAMFSNLYSLRGFLDLIDKNERKHDTASSIETTAVSQSTILISFIFVMVWRDDITKRHNHRRDAEVLKICWEVVLAMYYKNSKR